MILLIAATVLGLVTLALVCFWPVTLAGAVQSSPTERAETQSASASTLGGSRDSLPLGVLLLIQRSVRRI